MAPGTVIVTSTIVIPPAATASAAAMAFFADPARTTGTIPTSIIRLRTCSRVMNAPLLIDVRRLEPGRKQVNHQQRKQISRTGDEEDWHVAVSCLQDESGEAGDAHAADGTAESADSHYGRNRAAWKHVGYGRENVA